MQKEFYGIFSLFVTLFVLITAMQCKTRKEAIAKITGKVCVLGVIIALLNSITMLTNQVRILSICFSLLCISVVLALLLLLDYTMELTELGKIKPVYKWIAGSLAAVDAAFLLANPWTGFAIKYRETIYNGDLYLTIIPEGWYLVHLCFSYLLVTAILIMLIVKYCRVPLVYAGRYLLEAGVMVLALVFNLMFLYSKLLVDLSYLVYGLSAYCFYRIALQYRPVFVRGYARYLLMDKLQEPVVQFDIKGRLADFNTEAAEKFELKQKDLCEMTREHFVKHVLQISENKIEEQHDTELVYRTDYAEIVYRLRVKKLKSRRKLDMGQLYVFQDVTEQKRMYNALEHTSMYHALTGFYSNRIFNQKIEELDKEGKETIVAVCKITDLKLLNVVYSRKTGDKVIQVMSEELRAVLPEDALIAYSEDSRVLIAVNDITENQMNLYLADAARKIKKRALPKVPVFMMYGVARRENVAVSSLEYVKYAEMDMLLKKGKDSVEQCRLMTQAVTEAYYRNEYESTEHVKRITCYGLAMAEKLALSEAEKKQLQLLCCYHDIGRLKTREEIWGRAATITRDEFDIIKLHSVTGYQIASELELEYDIADLILYHHENFDGSGYPYGLAGEEIPLLARIIAIVDSYDVMIHDQRYKEAVTEEQALEELKKFAGTQFDPALVTLFEECLKEKGL